MFNKIREKSFIQKIALIGLFHIMLATFAQPAFAQTNDQIEAFLLGGACSRLPVGTCEALNATNAKNILVAVQSQLAAEYCGTGNLLGGGARQMLELGDAHEPEMCRKLLELVDR